MTVAMVEELVRIVTARLLLHLLGVARGRVTAQNENGLCTVQCAWGEIVDVSIAQPWPGCAVQGVAGSDVLLAWPMSTGGQLPGAPGELPKIVAFLSGTFASVDIGGNTPVARKDDATVVTTSTDATTMAWIASIQTFCVAVSARIGVPYVGIKPSELRGKIVEGSEKVRAG